MTPGLITLEDLKGNIHLIIDVINNIARIYYNGKYYDDKQYAYDELELSINTINKDPNINGIAIYTDAFLDSEHVDQLLETISYGDKITYLKLGECLRSDQNMRTLVGLLGQDSKLKTLNIQYGRVTDTSIEILAESLKSNTSLTRLKLSVHSVRNAAIQKLIDMFDFNTTITDLKLEDDYNIDTHLKNILLEKTNFNKANKSLFNELLSII